MRQLASVNQYPAALLVLWDEMATLARQATTRTRQSHATARTVHAGVFPDSLPEGGSDFNDMHQAAGLDAVRSVSSASMRTHTSTHKPQRRPRAKPAHQGARRPQRMGAPMAAPMNPAVDIRACGRGADQDATQPPNGCAAAWMCRPEHATKTAAGGVILSFADRHPNNGPSARIRAMVETAHLNTACIRHHRRLYPINPAPEEFAAAQTCAFVAQRQIGDQSFSDRNAVTFRVRHPAQWRRVGLCCNRAWCLRVCAGRCGAAGGWRAGASTFGGIRAARHGAEWPPAWGRTPEAGDDRQRPGGMQRSTVIADLDEMAQVTRARGECAYMVAKNKKGRAQRVRRPSWTGAAVPVVGRKGLAGRWKKAEATGKRCAWVADAGGLGCLKTCTIWTAVQPLHVNQ